MSSSNNAGSKSFNRAVNNLQGKLKNSFLIGYPHHTVPGCNLSKNPNVLNYDEEHFMDLFTEFPYDLNLPKPLLPPARLPQCVVHNSDPALQLLAAKAKIKDDINQITEYHEKYRKKLKVVHKKNVKWTKTGKKNVQTSLPRYIAELAEIIDSDPDPEFEGEYNWYYTGGCLDHLILADQSILVFPYGEELVATPIVDKGKSVWKPNLANATKSDLDGTLYEIRHSKCQLLGRQKYSCNLYTLSESNGELKLEEIHKQPSSLPYISADLSPIEGNKYCVVRSNRSVELWDINRVEHLSRTEMTKPETPHDNWVNVRFTESDPNVLVFVDRCCVHYIDLRTPANASNLSLCPKDNLETCESLSLNSSSKHNSFYHYLGTYHSLLLCDSRYGDSCIVQKWTHQFKSPPLFSGIVDRNNEEIVVLSSQLSGENSIILNNWTSECDMHSYSLPYMPLSITETLGACRDEGKCLDPSMRDRLELCNAGTTLHLNNDNNVTFFAQNSIDDIFYQCITLEKNKENTAEINKRSILALDAWEKAYLGQSKTVKPLAISEKANMKHIVSAMKNVNLKLEKREPRTREYEPRWAQSLEKLGSYVDILAPELLSAWDIRDNTVAVSVTPHEKVLSWLEKKTSSQSMTQSQEEPTSFNDSTENYSQELISVSQVEPEYVVLGSTNNSLAGQTPTHDVPVLEKRVKKTHKKRKYIAGF